MSCSDVPLVATPSKRHRHAGPRPLALVVDMSVRANRVAIFVVIVRAVSDEQHPGAGRRRRAGGGAEPAPRPSVRHRVACCVTSVARLTCWAIVTVMVLSDTSVRRGRLDVGARHGC